MSDWLIGIMILLAVFGGYVLTSLLLLRYPRLIHKKKQIHFKAVHISHRGGAGENLENTIDAFRHAANVGTHMFELDCHITLDNEVVVTHDEDLTRTTGCAVSVGEVLYKDLPLLRPSLHLDFQRDHVTVGKSDRKIPLLKDIYEQYPDMPINIDVKINNDQLIKQISELTAAYKREHITVWGNRSSVITNKCFKENPNIHLLFSMKRVLLLLFLFYSGLLPFVPLRESFYEVIMPSILLKRGRFSREFKTYQRILLNICDCLLMNRAMFRHLTERGIQTYLWVLNDFDEFERAMYFGATGVMTDFPTKLTEFLSKGSLPEKQPNLPN